MGELTLHDLKQTAEDAVRALAKAAGVETYVVVVAGNGQVYKSVSPDLKSHERGLVDEIEKASANPVVVWDEANPCVLKKAEEGLAKTKHAELHPIVAVMIESLNKLNNHKASRSTALKDSSSTPAWWPHSPKKYAERTQQLNIKDLTRVIDAVLAQVRGDAPRVERLRGMLAPHFKTGSCSLGTRAVFDAYFDFLLDEACRSGTGVLTCRSGSVHEAFDSAGHVDESPTVSGSQSPAAQARSAAVLTSGNEPQVVTSVAGRNSESSGRLSEFPTVCGGQSLPAFQAGNVHRPLPILQPVPESTKQELRVPLTRNETQALDVGQSPALLKTSSKDGTGSAVWSVPGVFTPQEYEELDMRHKRARTDAVSPAPDWSTPLAHMVPRLCDSSLGAAEKGVGEPNGAVGDLSRDALFHNRGGGRSGIFAI